MSIFPYFDIKIAFFVLQIFTSKLKQNKSIKMQFKDLFSYPHYIFAQLMFDGVRLTNISLHFSSTLKTMYLNSEKLYIEQAMDRQNSGLPHCPRFSCLWSFCKSHKIHFYLITQDVFRPSKIK